jgi:hypothetical protein
MDKRNLLKISEKDIRNIETTKALFGLFIKSDFDRQGTFLVVFLEEGGNGVFKNELLGLPLLRFALGMAFFG